MNTPDKLLEGEVVDQVYWDLLVDSSRISVNASHGTVTLVGVVDTYEDSLLAEDDALGVVGVTDVRNELLVGPAEEAIADEHIAAGHAAALKASKGVPPGSISVRVDDGRVTMSGRVPKTFQRVAAKHAIARVIGVRGITDEVVISREQLSNDVGAEVSAALARNRLLENAALRVSSLGSTIYLDGTVGSYTAKRTALYIARCAPGVAAVIDRTTVHGKPAFVP